MNAYLISLSLGNLVVMEQSAMSAWVKCMTEEIELDDMFIDREDLLERGYLRMETTTMSNVFLLIKE